MQAIDLQAALAALPPDKIAALKAQSLPSTGGRIVRAMLVEPEEVKE